MRRGIRDVSFTKEHNRHSFPEAKHCSPSLSVHFSLLFKPVISRVNEIDGAIKVANKLDVLFTEIKSICRNEEESRENQPDTCRKSFLTAPNGVLLLLRTTLKPTGCGMLFTEGLRDRNVTAGSGGEASAAVY